MMGAGPHMAVMLAPSMAVPARQPEPETHVLRDESGNAVGNVAVCADCDPEITL